MNTPTETKNGRDGFSMVNALAALIALVGVCGSVWFSMGMGLKACPLCLYQRSFVMAAAGVLIVGLLTSYSGSALLQFLALPAVIGGLGVAVFHVYLEWNGTLECPGGIENIGSAPQQSLAMFALLTLVLMGGTLQSCTTGECEGAGFIAAVVLGALFAVGTILSAPPLPPSPSTAYETPLIGCRPAYHAE